MWIDLSVPINEQTPVYPGDPKTRIEPAGVWAKDGYRDHYVSIGTHAGTHIDAPMHMLEDGVSLDKIPVEQFIGRGKYIEVSDNNFDAAQEADIQEGDIVLFCTGMSDKYHEAVYFEKYPAMSAEIAKFLVSKKIKMVGIDTCSVDNQEEFPIHNILLEGGVLIIENLTNLSRLTDKDFMVYALPLKLQLDGAPTRVVAEIKS